MKRNAVALLLLTGLVISAISLGDDKPQSIRVAEDVTIYLGTLDGKPLAWFDVGGAKYLYELDLNMTLPKAADLKKALLATLAQDKEHRDKIVFGPFTPSVRAPETVEVAIGKSVPLKVARDVLGELSKVRDVKLALSVSDVDGQGLDTRRVYIGGLLKSGKQPVTPEKLKSLLDPKMTHAEFVDRIQKDK